MRAERVHRAMLEHADRIASVRDVQRLGALRDLTGETIAVAVADLVCQGRATGACGTGRVRAIERSAA